MDVSKHSHKLLGIWTINASLFYQAITPYPTPTPNLLLPPLDIPFGLYLRHYSLKREGSDRVGFQGHSIDIRVHH